MFSRRMMLAAAGLLVLSLVAAGIVRLEKSGRGNTPGTPEAAAIEPGASQSADESVDLLATGSAISESGDSSKGEPAVDLTEQGDGNASGSSGSGSESEPEPEPEPVDEPEPLTPSSCPPQPQDAAAEAKLIASPDPISLKLGSLKGSFTIRNCGTEAVDWTVQSKPYVTLDPATGTLSPHDVAEVAFSVDSSSVATGSFAFKIKVSGGGTSTYVDVKGTKVPTAFVAQSPSPPAKGLKANPGTPTGCAAQCITKAWLTPNALSSNMSLEVKTHTPASIKVFVSKSPPHSGGPNANVPFFPEGAPLASTEKKVTSWTTVLSPLEPETKYHIVVQAIDENSGTSYRSGAFRTPGPAVQGGGQLAGNESGGCSVQCITQAKVSYPAGDAADANIEIKTHTPARIAVFVSKQAPSTNDAGEPHFPGISPSATTGKELKTSWTAPLELEAGSKYHVIVMATDEKSRKQLQVGEFKTPDAPKADGHVDENEWWSMTFHKIYVDFDGDDHGRGELSFRFEVDGEVQPQLALGERKIHSNRVIDLGTSRSTEVSAQILDPDGNLHDGFLPSFRVQGWERDWDGLVEFCDMGRGLTQADWDRYPACDMKTNTAGSGLVPVSQAQSCADLGFFGEFADRRCVFVETVDHGDDFPRFKVLVSYGIVSFR
jgi:hypothetical protein